LLALATVTLPAASISAAEGDWTPSWMGVRLTGELGFGQVALQPVPALGETGTRHAALAGGFGFEGEGWVRPQLGLGLRVSRGFYVPLTTSWPSSQLQNSYALIEPQILRRTVPRLFGPRRLLALSWRVSGGLGWASVHTDDPCGKTCDVVYVRSNRVSASVTTGGVLSVGPAGVYIGARFALDTSVDWSTALNVALGLEL
jgi:hypothetical protein